MKVFESEKGLVKAWVEGVPVGDNAIQQLKNIANLPFIHRWVAAMPDVHLGKGATVGSVIPTARAIIPAAVGVDIGCGMMAVKTTLKASDLPDSLAELRSNLEACIPVGFKMRQGHEHLNWGGGEILGRYLDFVEKHPKLKTTSVDLQLGTLGGGNHFIELCLDTEQNVWCMLHSGSRGAGNLIGRYFIEKAKNHMVDWFINLPDKDLAYLAEGTQDFNDYIEGLTWAQDYAAANREMMMGYFLRQLRFDIKPFEIVEKAINCHHNYAQKENHYGQNVWVTRKGAVSAYEGQLGIIPGSMGAKSFIVRGKGNQESFCSCSHGAGRVMSRTEAKKHITLTKHAYDTQGVECRKDADVLDESPSAYKDIDAVMAAQSDLVEVVATLKQVMCIKG